MKRRVLTTILALCLWPAAARAGLYNPAEPTELTLPTDFTQFRIRLNDLRSVGPDIYPGPERPFRVRYVVAAQNKEVPPSWDVARQLSQSGYWIRRQKYSLAIDLLDRLKKADRKNFLVPANLALALYLSPDFNTPEGDHFRLALRNVDEALAAWPATWDGLVERDLQSLADALATVTSLGLPPGPVLRSLALPPRVRTNAAWLARMEWNRSTYDRYRLAETYFRKLLELRQREFLKKTPEKAYSVDALFGTAKDPLRFVGDSGTFEPGQLAKKQRDKLPPDALAIVQQLLWMPDDPRLYWLLADLYSVQGETAEEKKAGITAAWAIFKEFGDRDTGKYRDHWNAPQRRSSPTEFHEQYEILAEYTRTHDLTPTIEPPPPPPDPPAADVRGLHWNSLLIGFGAGVVLVLFVLFQIQEIRRRRQKRTAMMARPARPAANDQVTGTNPLSKESQPGNV